MENTTEKWNNWDNNPKRSGRVIGGLFFVIIGILLLVDRMDAIDLPYWVFSWETFLITLGLFIGFRHSFRNPSWIVLVLIGTVFLLDDMFPGFSFRVYFWPLLVILAGVWLIMSPGGQKKKWNNWMNKTPETPGSEDDYLDSTSVFGGVKKHIISKDFKGGEVVTLFGGTELNLSQADLQGPVVLEITSVFAGTKLIVPSNWDVKSELVAVLGGVDDKRAVSAPGDANKVLILRGNAILGGIEIKSY